MKKIGILFLICTLAIGAVAQVDMKYNPDLQTVDDGFFDPTRKTEKVQDDYHFGMEYRIEGGYTQIDQRVMRENAHYTYMDGARMGMSFTFLLPYHFGLQTGLFYTITTGNYTSRYRSIDAESNQKEYINHQLLAHYLTVPIRAYYVIPMWRKLNLLFYTGPQLQIGVAQQDNLDEHLSDGVKHMLNGLVPMAPYDRYKEGELNRLSIQYGLGIGIEWDAYRLQGGYDFGLNNLMRQRISSSQKMWEWQWGLTFCYRFH